MLKRLGLILCGCFLGFALGQEEAHVHGLAQVNMVVTEEDVFLEFISPAANIVGFEYEAQTEDEVSMVRAAKDSLASAEMFAFSEGAECSLVSSGVRTSFDLMHHDGEPHQEHEAHDDHGHESYDEDEGHDHESHDDHEHESHDEDEGYDHESHDGHEHESHDEDEGHDHESHDDHDHESDAEHQHEENIHSEFSAEYHYHCAKPQNLKNIDTARLFESFVGIADIDVSYVTSDSQGAVELTPDSSSFSWNN